MISIYKNVSNTNTTDSIIGLGKTIEFKGYSGYTSDNEKDGDGKTIAGKGKLKYSISAVIDDLPALSYSTSWDLSPLAKVDTFVKDKTTKDIITSVASLSTTEHYDTPIANDEWSQLFPKDGSTVKFDIKFTAYYKTMLNTTNYFKIINNLLLALSPTHHNITDYADQIEKSVISAKTIGQNYKSYKSGGRTGWDGIKDDFLGKENIFTEVKKIIETVFNTESTVKLDQAAITKSLEKAKEALKSFFGNVEDAIIRSENTGGVDRFKVIIPHVIDNTETAWFFYITNFSFTPSVNTVLYNITDEENNGLSVEIPISMDFNITFESDRVLTNYDLNKAILL